MENKSEQNSRVYYLSENFISVVWGIRDITSKVKDHLLHLAPPTTKGEAQCLVVLFGL